jgi:hypothetical protein
LRSASSRAFRCEGPDQIERLFWWRRLPQGNYDVSQPMFPCLFAAACTHWFWGCRVVPLLILILCCCGILLQLYGAHGPAEVCIGLFRKHRPPEELIVGDNYATLYFRFLHGPLLLNALLALSLNRWLDFEDRPQF